MSLAEQALTIARECGTVSARQMEQLDCRDLDVNRVLAELVARGELEPYRGMQPGTKTYQIPPCRRPLPVRLVYDQELPSLSNARHRARKRARAMKAQRSWAEWHVRRALDAPSSVVPRTGGVVVLLSRISPRPLDDDDNLRGALKAVRDGVADALGIDDRDARVTWEHAQRRGAPKTHQVEIVIRARECGEKGAEE